MVNLEEFSSKSERGLKQEIYAHFTLINLARLFCNISRIQNGDDKNDVQYNFKNCLNLIGRNIQNLIQNLRYERKMSMVCIKTIWRII